VVAAAADEGAVSGAPVKKTRKKKGRVENTYHLTMG